MFAFWKLMHFAQTSLMCTPIAQLITCKSDEFSNHDPYLKLHIQLISAHKKELPW